MKSRTEAETVVVRNWPGIMGSGGSKLRRMRIWLASRNAKDSMLQYDVNCEHHLLENEHSTTKICVTHELTLPCLPVRYSEDGMRPIRNEVEDANDDPNVVATDSQVV